MVNRFLMKYACGICTKGANDIFIIGASDKHMDKRKFECKLSP